MAVVELSPQASHSQWWRISPPSTNSDMTGATIPSPQCGQRVGEEKLRIRGERGRLGRKLHGLGLLMRRPPWLLCIAAHRGEGETLQVKLWWPRR